MWLSSSSVGRKFIMALSGAFLVLFVTFHCLMNTVAICWPAAYNGICEFLGANWYALAASAVLALFVVVHIVYAVMLTVQNRRARGSERYAINKRPATVEWSSQNMLVLGIVILAFLVVHMIQFWAKMQWAEIIGHDGIIPPIAGTLFLQEAFSQIWTPIVYIIGFIALWFHLNHGFWSMFQSIGWDSTVWIPRLKKIGAWWVSIVIALFIAQAIVFTVNARNNYYKTNPTLREQYKEMLTPIFEAAMGQQAAMQVSMTNYDQLAGMVRQQAEQFSNPEARAYFANDPEFPKVEKAFVQASKLFDYLEEGVAPEAEQAPTLPNTNPVK